MVRTFKLSSAINVLFLASLLVGAGCSSSKNKNEESSSTTTTTEESSHDSDSGRATGLSTVYFDFDSSTLSSDAKSILEGNAKYLKENASVEVQIEGHCDERGGVQYNLALGEHRAKAAKRYLEAMGISSGRISTVSYGKERPVAQGHDESAWSQNRRANFVVTSK